MTWIDLGDPVPRSTPERYTPIDWRVGEVHQLPTPTQALDRPFGEVLDTRATHRTFGVVDDEQLGAFLWSTCRTRGSAASHLGFDLEHRAAPSAGATHPVHVVVSRPADRRWWLYQPDQHRLAELKDADVVLGGLYKLSLEVLTGGDATRLLLLAEPGKTLGKYQNGCSLVWRDAGVLLGVMSLTAAAQGLHFCPLGITGDPWARALADQGQLAGVGLALLGTATRA
ncbi:nitroreductase family protein [Pseudomonas sp.]|uniref:nitroreductase family protein n=1 Tax=Pseudomonas sp. TaxID=306 RepID=UPI001B2A7D41|nr:nitroreductase family protein [Pseudomonas sp.]MBO9548924.1 nitroreductase family protein [Pseudomonas sp.]